MAKLMKCLLAGPKIPMVSSRHIDRLASLFLTPLIVIKDQRQRLLNWESHGFITSVPVIGKPTTGDVLVFGYEETSSLPPLLEGQRTIWIKVLRAKFQSNSNSQCESAGGNVNCDQSMSRSMETTTPLKKNGGRRVRKSN